MLRCAPLLCLVLLSVWIGIVDAAATSRTRLQPTASSCSSVRSRLLHQREPCVDTRLSQSVADASFVPSIKPYAVWAPNQTHAIYVQSDYWFVALGTGTRNFQARLLLKVDASTQVPVASVTLDDLSDIVSILGNSSHIFVLVYRTTIDATMVLTFDASSLQQVSSFAQRDVAYLSGVNAAGTQLLLLQSDPLIKFVTLVNASTGLVITNLDGGRSITYLDAAAFDASTDTAIIADAQKGFIYGVALNNALLWTIPLTKDVFRVFSMAVDFKGRSLYIRTLSRRDAPISFINRYIQYDLVTLDEVAHVDTLDELIVPGAQFVASTMNGEIYIANAQFGTAVRINMTSGATLSTSFTHFPYLRDLAGLSSLNGSIYTAFTTGSTDMQPSTTPFMLHTISADGVVLRSTPIAASINCNGLQFPQGIDMDSMGNVFVPLCNLGVRVYTPEHELLHVIKTPGNTAPTSIAATLSGKYVYVHFSNGDRISATQLFEVASGNFVASFSSRDPFAPNAIAIDTRDETLWGIFDSKINHWATNTRLLSEFGSNLQLGYDLAIDTKHQRLVMSLPSQASDGHRLGVLSMQNGSLLQQFDLPNNFAQAMTVTKDGAFTVANEFSTNVMYFFRNQDDVSRSPALLKSS